MLFNKLYPSPTGWREGGGMAVKHLHIGDVVQFHLESPRSVFLLCSSHATWQFPIELLTGEAGCADLFAARLCTTQPGIEAKARWQEAAIRCASVSSQKRVTRLFGNIFNLSKEKESSDADPIFECLAGNVPSLPVEYSDYAIYDEVRIVPADGRTDPTLQRRPD